MFDSKISPLAPATGRSYDGKNPNGPDYCEFRWFPSQSGPIVQQRLADKWVACPVVPNEVVRDIGAYLMKDELAAGDW